MLKFLRPLSFIILALFLAAGAAAFALDAADALRSPEERDYGEGIVLWQAANVTDWETAFRPVEEYPHLVFHYPPLFHLTARLVAPLAGDLLRAGRLTSSLSLAASCLVAALLAAVCLPAGRGAVARWLGPLAAGTLFFTSPIWGWGNLMRVDALGVFLSLVGIALFVAAGRRPALAYLAFACFVAAVYTKHTMIAAPAACLLLSFAEKPRRALYLMLLAAAAGLAILFALQAATDGMFLRHVVGYNQNPFLLRHIIGRWIDHLSKLPALLVVASVMFPAALFARRARRPAALLARVRLALGRGAFERCVVVAAAYFWAAAAVVAVTIGKQGASYNYFYEFDLAACLLTGLALGWLLRRESLRPRSPHALLASLVVPLLILHTAGNVITLYKSVQKLARPGGSYSEELLGVVRGLPGPVYSEEMTVLMRAGKEIPAEPAIITALAMAGSWDESGFVRRIEEGQFEAVIVRTLDDPERFTEAVAGAVRRRYHAAREIGPWTIYLPK